MATNVNITLLSDEFALQVTRKEKGMATLLYI